MEGRSLLELPMGKRITADLVQKMVQELRNKLAESLDIKLTKSLENRNDLLLHISASMQHTIHSFAHKKSFSYKKNPLVHTFF